MSEVIETVEEKTTADMSLEERGDDFYDPKFKEENAGKEEENKETEESTKTLVTGEDEDSKESTETESEDSKKDEVATDEENTDEGAFKLELGEESPLDENYLKEVESFAKEKGLSNEVAQEWVAKQEAFIQAQVELAQEAEDEQIEAWRQEVIDDPKWGGDNLKKTSEDARRVVEKFGGENLIQILNDTGYGNHPEVVTFLARLGGLMSEDSLILPGADMAQEKSVEELFYGKN